MSPHRLAGLVAAAAAGLALASAGPPARAEGPARVDFGRDVLPILSDRCFHCHGPDPATRKAGLRLDTPDDALRPDGPLVVPGEPEESELIARVASDDPFEVMPPPKANRPLTPDQVETLRRWVEQGAEWGSHWAFAPPARPEPPPVAREDWARNPIDRFVLARLEREGLEPAPEAPKEALLRRVTLDLSGLPPTPDEVDAFLADDSPDAYEKVVARLLASPRYGERMAADWLDLARFADTHGFQMDRERPVWPYRDWVIRALNANLPYDQFVTWQLAGDLVPDPTKETRLATAFNRLHLQNEEGGIVPEEFRVAYVVDRVNTMGTAFLGLTLECARCHDHKYDPITQRDYYALFAFFQNIDESGQTSYFTSATPVPALPLSDDAADAEVADLRRRAAAAEAEFGAARSEAIGAFRAWLADRPAAPTVPGLVGSYDFESLDGGKVANAADPEKPAKAVDAPALVDGPDGKAAELNGEDGFTFPEVGHFTRSDPFTLALRLRAPEAHAERAVVVHHSRAWLDAASRGYEIVLEHGRVAVGLHHMWPGNALKVVTERPIPAGEWVHLAVTYDGSSRAEGVRVYLDGVAQPLEVVRDKLAKDITYEGGEPDLAIGHRFRDNGFKGGRVDAFRVFDRRLSALEVAHLAGRPDLSEALAAPASDLDDARREALFDYFLGAVHPPALERLAAVKAARRAWSDRVNAIPEIMVMEELPEPKPAYILKRGAYDAPGDRVEAGTPSALPTFGPELPQNRLGLARWLLDPDHPLTSRVAVNRLWQTMFGAGLVETSDNFGRQGAQPTHPDLLDWLARDFAEHGWDVKRAMKQIALSATYRQDSRPDPSARAADPNNRLLARAPVRRLSAEMLRDQALFAGGLLVEKLGGPSVRPYQPEGLWDVAMGRPNYQTSKGDGLYRRSLYTFWKRTVPHPAMVTFDAAERNVCVARRQETSTPLQALALLNDPQIVEAARHLGRRMLRESGADSDLGRARWAFRVAAGRAPTDREAEILARLLAEQRAEFAADPESAAKLLAVGESPADPELDPVEQAAAAVLAQAILNSDAAVNRR